MMMPNYSFAQTDSLFDSYTSELNANQSSDKYIDSLCLAIYKNYSMETPDLFKKLSDHLTKVYHFNNSKRILGWARYYLGFYNNIYEEFTESVYHLEEALAIFRELGNYQMVAATYNQLGLSYFQQGNTRVTTDYLIKALKSYEQYGYNKEIYSVLINLGILHLEIDPNKSIEYLISAINSANKYNNQVNLSLAYIQLTKAYLRLHNIEKAKDNLRLAKEQNKLHKSEFIDNLIVLYSSEIYKNEGDFYNALKGYEYLSNKKKFKERDYIFSIYYNIADIDLKLNKYSKAIEYYRLALEFKDNNSESLTSDIYQGMAKSFSQLNKIDSAIKYYNLFTETKDIGNQSIISDEAKNILYNYELNKKELDLQKVRLESKNQENQFKNFVLMGAAFIIIVLTFFIVIYYKSYKRNFQLSQRLQNEVKENEKINQELLHAKTRVEESDNFKSAIIRNMTHEIRTPFNGLLGFVTLMRKRSIELDDEELLEYSELVELSGKRVYELVSNLNDLALLESNDYQLHFGLTYLPDIINEVYFQYINAASTKGLFIKLENIDDVIFETDSVALSKSIKNVVDNAIKFTSKGFISISSKLVDGDLDIIIEDTGIGISEEHIQNIGLPFKQVDMSISRSYEGMGIGLAVTKKILQKLNGDMIVESEPSVGTKIIFRLKQIKLENNILEEEVIENNSL